MTDDFNKNPKKGGYGNPPEEHQFKPGKSGNPKGRPKGSKNFLKCLDKNLEQKVSIKENGKITKKSKREIIASQLVNKAASGDLKAISNIVPYLAALDMKEEEKEKILDFLNPDEKEVMEILIDDLREEIKNETNEQK